MKEQTKEKQYSGLLHLRSTLGLSTLGLMTNGVWHGDPRRLGIVLARYKFAAKMLSGLGRVLEVGCADAFGTRIVQQEVSEVVAVDFDPLFIQDVESRMDPKWPLTCRVHDMLESSIDENFNGVYAIDVMEHIHPKDEDIFLGNIVKSLDAFGVCLIGMPSLESQEHASPQSRDGHVNCKSGPDLKATMKKHFHNVFLFSMNDEVVHTGYHKMAHYIWTLCTGPKCNT